MRKFTLLFLFAICGILVNAQTNLLQNPSLENWTSGVPDSWTLTTGTGTITQEQTKVKAGNSSIKVVATGTYGLSQMVDLVEGKAYTISFSYFIEAGDGTDARIWTNFMSGDGKYWTMSVTDSLNLKGPGGGSKYFADEKGVWKTYSASVVVPTGYPKLSLLVRSYNKSTVYWDAFSVVEGNTTGISNNVKIFAQPFVSGNTLIAKDAAEGSAATLYDATGKKIRNVIIENGQASLGGLSKGFYVVKIGNTASKVLVK
ncbi:MAG: hypothetical protein BGN96_09400 [Bacteroidales bacterium 45-6]|nr:MAG: hypothetical protein BGN96_09400 [Bacteroidales bacterium 45-6]